MKVILIVYHCISDPVKHYHYSLNICFIPLSLITWRRMTSKQLSRNTDSNHRWQEMISLNQKNSTSCSLPISALLDKSKGECLFSVIPQHLANHDHTCITRLVHFQTFIFCAVNSMRCNHLVHVYTMFRMWDVFMPAYYPYSFYLGFWGLKLHRVSL